jgi:hypothetical protein
MVVAGKEPATQDSYNSAVLTPGLVLFFDIP